MEQINFGDQGQASPIVPIDHDRTHSVYTENCAQSAGLHSLAIFHANELHPRSPWVHFVQVFNLFAVGISIFAIQKASLLSFTFCIFLQKVRDFFYFLAYTVIKVRRQRRLYHVDYKN